ncbi:aminoglycoside phosphotransferase family protein [Acidaminobacter sp. JC074]|uniref:phosphotransferase n=1 Tax=Acidaminobacter sp. JC074 TaxID=2530199 RepID=UPI001F1173C0|nr:phosphotransferase [Acidaminobacter sp. JC074]MCH4888078.1 aminoglycoside phosphotransferase family protein [Acidaminobacter sp. JC074]
MTKYLEFKNNQGLYTALTNMLKTEISKVTGKTTKLHGGTVGEVELVEGFATTSENKDIPYKVVHKIQKQWKRHADPDSWLREYDLYHSELDTVMSDDLRWPSCYHLEKKEDKVEIWMEYIDGISGHDLTLEMFGVASREIGRFQGKLLRDKPPVLSSLNNLSRESMIKEVYHAYVAWPETYDYVRSESCELPKHICKLLIDNDERSKDVWQEIEKLPLTFSHRDYWVTNIFYVDGKIRLIDWDTTGWGAIGEDIASLIIDETAPDMVIDYYKTCVPAYIEGLSEFVDMSAYKELYIYEQMLLFFGYRLVEDFKFSKSESSKQYCLDILQKLYELKDIK